MPPVVAGYSSRMSAAIPWQCPHAPAVVVNPDASPAALLAWARGQLRALRVMAVGCEDQDTEHLAELPEAVATMAEQVEAVLDVLGGKLTMSKTRRGDRRREQ